MARDLEASDRCQPMLLPAAVDDCVSSASPVRAIGAFIDSLDLPALGLKTRNDFSEGRSSHHPGSLLKPYLWGYLKPAIEFLIERIRTNHHG